MRPYFVVRNSLFGLAVGLDRKDRRATTTFEALPGQDCGEGVVVALPKCDNATGKPAEAEAEADPGESHHDDSSEANKLITAPTITKVQLVQGEGGLLCLSFSLNDGTDLNIFDSSSTGTTSNGGDMRSSGSTVFRIARAAYPHLLHFSRLTNHETSSPNNPNDFYDDRNNCNPSASQYISVDSKYVEVLNSSTVAVSIAVSTEPVRNARIYDNISFADLHGMVRQVQKQIPAARPDDGCLNLSQFLAFSCLLDQHVANERDAAPRISVRILKRSDHSLRIVLSSSNKACRITAKAHPRECGGTNHSAEASIGIAKEQEGILELGGLKENTEYSIDILGYCPLSKISARATFVCRTKDAEPKMYPSWSEMSRGDQETELLAVVKDRAIRNLAAMEDIATDLTKSMSGDEAQVDLASSFALWWSQNERAREEFCLREARHASKDPAIRQSAEKEGIIIKSRDWESSTTDVSALCRRRSFCWWYYEMQPAKRVGTAIHRDDRDQATEKKETHTVHYKAPITPSFLPFSPPPVSRPKEAGPEKSTTKSTLQKYPQTQYKEPKHQTLQPDNVFVVTNRFDGAAWGRPEDECNGDSSSSEKERNVDAVEDTLHAENSSTGSNEIGLSAELILTPLQQDLARTSIHSAESNATSTKDTNLSQPEAETSTVVDDASAKPQGDRPTTSAQKAGIPETVPKSTYVPAIHHSAGTVGNSDHTMSTRKPPNRSKRSTFLGARTAKAKKAVGEVDEMLSFQINAKNLRGVALLKAKVRLVMITARLQALRHKSGCKDDAKAMDHVDLFDEDDTEQSSQQQRIETDASRLSIGPDKKGTAITPSPLISDTSNKNTHTKNTEDRSLALANVTDIYKRAASRGVKGAYQAWKLNIEEQKMSEAHRLEGSNAPVDDSLADESSVTSTSLKGEENAFDASDSSSSSLASGASTEPSDSSLAVNSLPIHACAESPQHPTERFAEVSLTASEDVDNRTVCTCRKYCMSLDEDMDNDNWITDASEYFVQNTNILNLLSAMAYSNGSGTRISKQEYEIEYRHYIENSSTPLADLGPRFVASE